VNNLWAQRNRITIQIFTTFWHKATMVMLRKSHNKFNFNHSVSTWKLQIWKITIKAGDPGQTCGETSSKPPIRCTYVFFNRAEILHQKICYRQKVAIKQLNEKKEIPTESRETKNMKSTSNSVSKLLSTSSDNIWERPTSTIFGESICETDVLQYQIKNDKISNWTASGRICKTLYNGVLIYVLTNFQSLHSISWVPNNNSYTRCRFISANKLVIHEKKRKKRADKYNVTKEL